MCLFGQDVHGHTWFEWFAARVHVEDGFPSPHIGRRNHDHAIEPTGPQQRWIEHVRAVGGGNDDHARVVVEPVHLDQDLIERLLALIVGVTESSAALATDRVDFVDEDDAWCALLGRCRTGRARDWRQRRRTSPRTPHPRC